MTLPVGEVVCGDCLEVMRGWPDKCVDWCITDPPYGIGAPNLKFPQGSGKAKMKGKAIADMSAYSGGKDWDNAPLSAAAFAEIQRVSVNWAVFGAEYYSDILPAGRQWIIWDKVNDGTIFGHVELVCTSRKGPNRIIRFMQNGCLIEGGERKQHPTGKPEGLMRRLISLLTKPGDTVLDPFAGSGSTLVAAERLGLPWIGIEIDPVHCETARRRTAQQGLFTGAAL